MNNLWTIVFWTEAKFPIVYAWDTTPSSIENANFVKSIWIFMGKDSYISHFKTKLCHRLVFEKCRQQFSFAKHEHNRKDFVVLVVYLYNNACYISRNLWSICSQLACSLKSAFLEMHCFWQCLTNLFIGGMITSFSSPAPVLTWIHHCAPFSLLKPALLIKLLSFMLIWTHVLLEKRLLRLSWVQPAYVHESFGIVAWSPWPG